MSHRQLRKAKPRRAVGVDYDAQANDSAGVGGARTVKGLATHGLAALAISALGLAVTGSVAADSAAQTAESSRTSTVGHASHDHSTAVTTGQPRGIADDQPTATGNQPDAFGRSADTTSRTAERDEIDRAITERAGARSAEQQRVAEEQRIAEEQQRIAEEQRKAEEQRMAEAAAKRQQEEAARTANPASTPMAKDRYSLGARWGAVGAWSRYHTGQDLSAAVGTPIYAVAPGVVDSPNAGGWAGVHAVIKHSDGSSLYAHMASVTVNPGQEVNAGDLIGYVGMTGRTFGPHLHFEYYPNGASTSDPYSTADPYKWLQAKGVRL